jgi:UDP-N-acetylmuramoyl-tripeptide--D-alanyl-D-alanine ligase
MQNTIESKFEIITEAKDRAPLIANADDKRVTQNYDNFIGDHNISFFSAENHKLCGFSVKDKRFHTDGSGISFRLYHDGEEVSYTKVPHLGDYIVGNVIAGVLVGRQLGIDPEEILTQAQKITPAERRLQPVQRTSSDILVIDDSYNGTSDGVQAAIETLDKFVGRRKVCVTTGLVEIGDQSREIHNDIGRQLADVADVVVLVESSVTDWIKSGLEEGGFAGELYTFKSQSAMQDQISNLTVSGDVVLFQNDWPENYRWRHYVSHTSR